MDSPPSAGTCIRAVTRATTLRQRRAKSDSRFQSYSMAALQERITGFTVEPRLSPDGWWLVGYVLDDIGDDAEEFDVWLRVDQPAPRIGLSARPRATIVPLEPKRTGRYFCGERLRWFGDDEERPEPHWSPRRSSTNDSSHRTP